MSEQYQELTPLAYGVCGSIVPDPLQTLEPVASRAGTGGPHSAENEL